MMQRNGLSLHRSSLHQNLAADLEKLVVVTGLQNSYLLSQIGNANEMPVYVVMPSSYTVDDTGAKSVAIKTSGYEKMHVTLMLAVLADGSKLPQ
jgi:hypothetical protein